jgi:hypothetical protein
MIRAFTRKERLSVSVAHSPVGGIEEGEAIE